MRKKTYYFKFHIWEYNLLQHNLDEMHIEKNCCDNIIFMLINDKEKR